MASRPRRDIIDESVVGIYHCTARCVRRAFLCGKDPYTGKDYDHRKTWIRDRRIQLAAVMAVEPSFYAAMDNHLHVLPRNRPDLVKRWSDEEVIRRACRLFVYKFEKMGVQDQEPTDQQLQAFVQDEELVKEMRTRLSSISWLITQPALFTRWYSSRYSVGRSLTGSPPTQTSCRRKSIDRRPSMSTTVFSVRTVFQLSVDLCMRAEYFPSGLRRVFRSILRISPLSNSIAALSIRLSVPDCHVFPLS